MKEMANSKRTVMVVDDEPDVREAIKLVLEKEGYRVLTAKNGDDCLNKLKKEKPNLILLDIMMPGMPVREVTSRIKGIKIAYLTVVRVSEAEKGLLHGQKNVVGFIQKPFDINDLAKKVRKMLG